MGNNRAKNCLKTTKSDSVLELFCSCREANAVGELQIKLTKFIEYLMRNVAPGPPWTTVASSSASTTGAATSVRFLTGVSHLDFARCNNFLTSKKPKKTQIDEFSDFRISFLYFI